MKNETNSGSQKSPRPWLKGLVLLVAVASASVLYVQFGDALTLESLAARESQLRTYQTEHPVVVFVLAYAVYTAVTAFSLPGAAVLTLTYGWYFGLVPGVILVSFSSTSGATLAFLISRYLLRDTVQRRFGKRMESFNQSLERDGAFYLFTLRLIPAVPFFVINLVMGLTPVRVRTYWWVSQLGMLPGTMVYVFAGSRVPSLETLAEKGINAVFTPSQLTQIVLAFVLLGVFPLVVRTVMNRVGKNRTATAGSSADPVTLPFSESQKSQPQPKEMD